MLDLLLLVVLALVVLEHLDAARRRATSSPRAAVQPTQPSAGPPPEVLRRMAQVVRPFGLSPAGLRDLRALPGPQPGIHVLAAELQATLHALLAQGAVRGPEVTALIEGTRALKAQEALFFAIYDAPRSPQGQVMFAFVGRAPARPPQQPAGIVPGAKEPALPPAPGRTSDGRSSPR